MCPELKVGQYMTFQVEEVKNDGRVVQLCASPSTIAQACAEPKQGWNLTNLLPGLLVKASIKKVKTVLPLTATFLLPFLWYNIIHFPLVRWHYLSVSYLFILNHNFKWHLPVWFAGDQARSSPELLVLLQWPGGFSPHGAWTGIQLHRGTSGKTYLCSLTLHIQQQNSFLWIHIWWYCKVKYMFTSV